MDGDVCSSVGLAGGVPDLRAPARADPETDGFGEPHADPPSAPDALADAEPDPEAPAPTHAATDTSTYPTELLPSVHDGEGVRGLVHLAQQQLLSAAGVRLQWVT